MIFFKKKSSSFNCENFLGFERWNKRLNESHSVTVVAIEASTDSIVGFISVGQRRSQHDTAISPDSQKTLQEIDGELYAVYLLDKAKRKGVATQLWKLASSAARERFKLTRLMCWVLQGNTTAM